MKTASHFTYTGPGRIVISRGAPRGGALVGGFRILRTLAPTREILFITDQDEYRRRYRAEVLGRLDPQKTWDTLHQMAGEGNEPVIQCFERPPFTATNWCHRRMVAEWFLETLGHTVDELAPEAPEDFRRNKAEYAERTKAACAIPHGSTVTKREAIIPRRLEVEAVRDRIDAFWHRVCAAIGITRNWAWSGLPDAVREQMQSTDLDEWDALQDRYRRVY